MNPDRYVASLKRLYLSILVLTFSVVYFAMLEYNRVSLVNRLELLQVALAVHDMASQLHALHPLTEQDLARLSSTARIRSDRALFKKFVIERALHEHIPDAKQRQLIKEWDAQVPWAPFSQTEITGALFGALSPSLVLPRGHCNVAILRGGPPSKQIAVTTVTLSYSSNVNLSDIYVVHIADVCNLHISSYLLIDMSKENNVWLIGVPETYLSDVLYAPYMTPVFSDILSLMALSTSGISAADAKLLLSQYPPLVREYLGITSSYFVVTRDYIEDAIFRNAKEITGTSRAPNDLQGAIADMSKAAADSYATVAGINAPVRVLIKAAPFVLVGILYLMLIQLRQLKRFWWQKPGEPWLFRDVSGRIGRIVAYVTAIFPVVAVVWVFFAFADLQGASVDVSGKLWSIREIFGLEPIRQLEVPGDYDSFLADAALILFVVALYLAGQSVRSVISLIRRFQTHAIGPRTNRIQARQPADYP